MIWKTVKPEFPSKESDSQNLVIMLELGISWLCFSALLICCYFTSCLKSLELGSNERREFEYGFEYMTITSTIMNAN